MATQVHAGLVVSRWTTIRCPLTAGSRNPTDFPGRVPVSVPPQRQGRYALISWVYHRGLGHVHGRNQRHLVTAPASPSQSQSPTPLRRYRDAPLPWNTGTSSRTLYYLPAPISVEASPWPRSARESGTRPQLQATLKSFGSSCLPESTRTRPVSRSSTNPCLMDCIAASNLFDLSILSTQF